ncbi:hypothetical protein [Streptomyces sp. BA2]|uniref:hypothetical protein n=1 Tax=Streptomyces sp. BA2 TaxID=436595 RepID=UPI001325EC79|nr:hypothetical protein [Streptomyces sp. BA2]MWA07876.1 hypothetical protein [Streptomyces sp. BA2]
MVLKNSSAFTGTPAQQDGHARQLMHFYFMSLPVQSRKGIKVKPSHYPTEQQVREALRQQQDRARASGRRPSTLALARHFGLPNTSFRRAFPDIAHEVSRARYDHSGVNAT